MHNVFTTSFNVPYFSTVVKHVLEHVNGDVLALSDVAIVVPSPRIATGLKQAFAKEHGGSLLLPNIRTLSFSEEDLDVLRFEEDVSADAISPLARLMILAGLVRAKSPDLPYVQILDDAWHLGQIFSRFSAYDVTTQKLLELLPDDLSEAWKDNLDFLKIACEAYPKWLEDQNKIDASIATQNYMNTLVEKSFTTASHIFAVGFNDTTPAGLKVLADILKTPNGQLIFPPFEKGIEQKDETHALFGVGRLISLLGIAEDDILMIGDAKASPFLQKNIAMNNVAHIALLQANHVQEEAEAIALMMRESLEAENKTCALISPDRELATRVIAALRYWNIDVDDSAGVPLNQTGIGEVVVRYLNMLLSRFDAMQTAAFLYHPMVKKLSGIDAFNTYVLEGTAPAYGLEGLRKKLHLSKANENQQSLCADILETLEAYSLNNNGKENLFTLIQSLLKAMKFWLNTGEGDDADALLNLLSGWVAEADYVPELDLSTFAKTLEKMMSKVAVRNRYGMHPRLFVWGAMEARLQNVDRVIIGGLNEGAWPRKVKADPWLNRNMMGQLGLLDPQIYIGLSAYDFLHLCHAKEVYWTRTIKDSEGETVPSRFLMQLKASMQKGVWDALNARGDIWKKRVQKLRECGSQHHLQQPLVQTNVEDRPNMWSPSLLAQYMACPYQVFVERVLKITKPKPYNEDPSAADKGELIHKCLEAMVHKIEGLPEPFTGNWADEHAVESHLLSIGEVVFGAMEHEGRKAVWWQKFKRIAKGFAQEMVHIKDRRIVVVEEQLRGDLPNGVKLKARVDRMDKDREGHLYILDYKTGLIPSWEKVKTGEAPQMGVEAVLAEDMGYTLGGLEYWSVKGERHENVVRKFYKGDLEELQDEARKGLEKLANELTSEGYAYKAVPGSTSKDDRKGACGVCDYAGLCRYKDWVEKQK